MFKFTRTIAVVFGVLLIAACASGAKPVAMVPSTTPVAAINKFAGAITVATVTGGEETSPLWTSEISNADFQVALMAALKQAGFSGASEDYALNVELLEISQPLIGISMTVTSTVRYSLTDRDGITAFSETVQSPHTAQFSESFLAVERLRLANEGSARANLGQFIKLLEIAGDAPTGSDAVTS